MFSLTTQSCFCPCNTKLTISVLVYVILRVFSVTAILVCHVIYQKGWGCMTPVISVSFLEELRLLVQQCQLCCLP